MNKLITSTLVIVLMLISCGEKERIVEVPVPADCPPSAPRGVYAVNLDGYVTICWYPNAEEDIAGYDVYRGEALYGDYFYIGTVDAKSPDPYEYCFDDTDTGYGVQFYYAVTAFDNGGLESGLSFEEVTGTPRPEGLIMLNEHEYIPEQSGYDFSGLTNEPQLYSLASTDIYFGVNAGASLIAFRPGVDIQDYGFVQSFDAINYAPEEGWAPTRSAEAIAGHCYILRLVESDGNHYVKLYVTEVTSTFVRFWWAYQTDPGNRDLVPSPGGDEERNIVKLSGGVKENRRVKVRRRINGRQLPPSFGEGNDLDMEDDL